MISVDKQSQFKLFLQLVAGVCVLSLIHVQVVCSQETVIVEKAVDLERVQLLTKESLETQWDFYSGKVDAVLTDTWTLQTLPETNEHVLICKGEPFGYIRTKQAYRNYRIGLEWKFPSDKNGNSGILIHTCGEDRIWPKSLQIQLHQPVAGSTFPGGGTKTVNELRDVPMLSKPVNQWNSCVITSLDGEVTVTINDQSVGKVTGVDPFQGKIALQSEGAEVHFKNIWIEELPIPVKIESANEDSIQVGRSTE